MPGEVTKKAVALLVGDKILIEGYEWLVISVGVYKDRVYIWTVSGRTEKPRSYFVDRELVVLEESDGNNTP